MKKKVKSNKRDGLIRKSALLLSILLHFLIILIYGYFNSNLNKYLPDSTPPKENSAQKKLTFELVETPENVPDKLPSEHTDLISDQRSRASDINNDENLEKGLPFNDGIVSAKNYPSPLPEKLNQKSDETREIQKSESSNKNEKQNIDQDSDIFISELLKRQTKKLQKSIDDPEPDFKNIISRSSDFGGFSFNTYNWNFAPYLIAMKSRIRNNINLPYAFTHLGAISGIVKVYFVVQPSGIVSELNIISSDAHYSLEQSSINAIEKSSAFLPLPSDFPEDKLEVTASFSFSIIKDKD